MSNSPSLSAALKRLGLRPAGGNYGTLHRLIEHYGISTDHLDPNWTRRGPTRTPRRDLHELLVEHSTYNRGWLKRRLYESGLKTRLCELCGQGETWRGRRMSLILDHINGVGDDNRIENLQIVCPNCAATLDTHCGKQSREHLIPLPCAHCGAVFDPSYRSQRFCSQLCAARSSRNHAPNPERRKVQRPSYAQLMAELEESNWEVVARRYGVSGNAVRKWVRWYEADAARRADDGEPGLEQ